MNVSWQIVCRIIMARSKALENLVRFAEVIMLMRRLRKQRYKMRIAIAVTIGLMAAAFLILLAKIVIAERQSETACQKREIDEWV